MFNFISSKSALTIPSGPAGKGEFIQIRNFASREKCHLWNQII